jgi:plastocyanin
VLVGVLAFAALALAGCGGSSSNSSQNTTPTTTAASGGKTLDATVGPGFTITLDQNGKSVSTLAPGTYTINVDDKSDIHNFHLTGPGVDKATDVGGTGTETWTVDLEAGSYHFQCDPHASSMNGSFTVSG